MTKKKSDFFTELKRRNIYRVATVYAITSWIIIEVISTIFPYLYLPEWLITAFIILALIGFPVSLVLAWIYEKGPEGFIRTTSPEAEDNPLPPQKRKPFTGTLTIVILLVLLIGQFVYFSFISGPGEKDTNTDPLVETSLLPHKSIAVLPFKNLSIDSDNQYFSDGIMEAILNNLTRIKDLKVVSRTSVERYRNDIKPIPEIASELEVGHILEGSVQKIGDNVRITVQLIAADQDEHIWATHYDRDIRDIFVVQSEIAKTIAENLKIILTSEERELIENSPTTNLKAYDLYLRAIQHKRATKKDIETIIGMLKEAISLDPNFALAYGSLGEYLNKLNRFDVPEHIFIDSAMAMLKRSLELDPANVDAYRYRSAIYFKLKRKDKAKEDLLKGLQYNPNDFFILKYLGLYFESMGDFDRGIDYMLKSLAVNKLDYRVELYDQLSKMFENTDWQSLKDYYEKSLESNPESPHIFVNLMKFESCDRNFEKALQYSLLVEKVDLEMNFDFPIGYCYLNLGHYEKADEYFNRVIWEEDVDNGTTFLKYTKRYQGLVKIGLGEPEAGKAMIQAYKESLYEPDNYIEQKMNYNTCLDLARIYCFENKKDEAFTWLERSVELGKNEETFWLYFWLMSDPYFDDIRKDGRFKALLMDISEIEEYRSQLLQEKLAAYHARNQLMWLSLY